MFKKFNLAIIKMSYWNRYCNQLTFSQVNHVIKPFTVVAECFDNWRASFLVWGKSKDVIKENGLMIIKVIKLISQRRDTTRPQKRHYFQPLLYLYFVFVYLFFFQFESATVDRNKKQVVSHICESYIDMKWYRQDWFQIMLPFMSWAILSRRTSDTSAGILSGLWIMIL